MARDWVEWHRSYADPDSELSQRLAIVTAAIEDALSAAPAGPIAVLSLCAGEARDLCGAAHGHPRAADVRGCAVELNAGLASIAAQQLRAAGTSVEVRCADAGRPIHWDDLLPVDLLLLAGIFGNLADADVQRTVAATATMVRPGGTIIWTRHRRAPDLTPNIRDWFDDAGCTPIGFTSAGPNSYAVGVERMGPSPVATPLPEQLFRFVDADPARAPGT
jgi:hypothetical protein